MRKLATSTINVRELGSGNYDQWDRFVEKQAEATFFHRAAWKDVIEKSFGHRAYYMCAEKEGRIEAVLPLARIKSAFFGDALISTPFCVYGGIVASGKAAHNALEAEACSLADRLGVDYLEMRYRHAVNPEWPTKFLYSTFRKDLDSDTTANFSAIPKKQRAMVRKGISAGLQATPGCSTEVFYRAYSESVRNLGTPVFPKKYFDILRTTFGKHCELLAVTTEDDRLVAGVLSFYFRDEVLPYYGGGTKLARSVKGNDFMYWDLMQRACERGIKVFDYGRSKKNTGSYHFKKHWGFTPEQLHYEYYLVRSRSLPDLSPNNPKYRAFIGIWKRLPLPLATLIGPYFARYFG